MMSIKKLLMIKLTNILGFLSSIENKALKNLMIYVFLKIYKINDFSEFEEQIPYKYASFSKFFARPLKKGARVFPKEEGVIIFPADGMVSQHGKIENGLLLQIKDKNYKLSDLLSDEKLAEDFIRGCYCTIYLSPKNYHRVHMPLNGILQEIIHIPGGLLSVNKKSLLSNSNVYTENERVVFVFQSDFGRKFCVVMIGAVIVGGISTKWHGIINSCHKEKKNTRWTYCDKSNVHLNIGDELGAFEIGSTVVFIFDDHDSFKSKIDEEISVKIGDVLGTYMK